MAHAVCKILDICRFCLLHDDLIPITQAIESMVTIQDIENFTGIQITDEEQLSFAICKNCCKVLENSVAYRNICLNNDVVFKQLFSVVIESIKDEENDDSTQIKDDSSNDESDDQIGADGPSFDATFSSASDAEDLQPTTVSPIISNSSIRPNRPRTKGPARAKAKGKADEKSNTSTEQKIEKEKTVCYTCGKLVTNLPNHMINHNKERRYSCPHCPLKMSNGTNMKKHIEAVHEKKIAKSCELCGEGFIHLSTFVRHMTSKHGIGETYECKICSKTFTQVDKYRRHMNKWHKARTEYPCTICNKVFNGRQRLKIHQSVHSDDQPYACRICPKRFKSKEAKRTHEITHTGIRFSCTLCQRSYKYKNLLNRHYRYDHGAETSVDGDNYRTQI